MNSEEKARRWQAYLMCLPLTIEDRGRGYISYGGVQLYSFCPNLFYGRLFYGPFHIGGASPFYSVQVHGPWAELCFDDDDYAPLPLYETADEKAERTQRFWERVDEQTRRIRDMARERRDLRAFLGAMCWLSPRCREVVVKCVPVTGDLYSARAVVFALRGLWFNAGRLRIREAWRDVIESWHRWKRASVAARLLILVRLP